MLLSRRMQTRARALCVGRQVSRAVAGKQKKTCFADFVSRLRDSAACVLVEHNFWFCFVYYILKGSRARVRQCKYGLIK